MKATGDCFEVAGKLITNSLMFGAKENLVLVHAVIVGQGPIHGVHHVHAWVENLDSSTAIDKSNGKDLEVDSGLFRAMAKVQREKTYTQEEARRMILEHETWGPWEIDDVEP